MAMKSLRDKKGQMHQDCALAMKDNPRRTATTLSHTNVASMGSLTLRVSLTLAAHRDRVLSSLPVVPLTYPPFRLSQRPTIVPIMRKLLRQVCAVCYQSRC